MTIREVGVKVFAGQDVSLASVAVCVIDEFGEILWQGKTDGAPGEVLDALGPWRASLVLVGLEAGPTSDWIGGCLVEASVPTICLETRHVKAALAAMTVKTDGNDARGLAQIVRTGWFAHSAPSGRAFRRHPVSHSGVSGHPGMTPLSVVF